jgi:phosphoribosylanthranilate isomerase
MPLKVKICGITNLDDALAAVEAGADAVGFVFHRASPRHVSLGAACRIIHRLPLFVAKVGVFVNPNRETVNRALGEAALDTVQFHGEERPEFCEQFLPVRMIKAFRIANADSLLRLPAYKTHAWLLDSFVPGQRGGTGATFTWELAVQAKGHGVPIILAGGLTPDNVAQGVRTVQPFAVDVSSGVEAAPGKKDHAKLRAFIEAAKGRVAS